MHYVLMFKRVHRTSCFPVVRDIQSRYQYLRISLLIFCIVSGMPVTSAALLAGTSTQIQSELNKLDTELARLPNPTPTATPWTLGVRTKSWGSPDQQTRIDILFPATNTVDLVVLMPAAQALDGYNPEVFGFPEHFLLEHLLPDGSRNIIADYRDTRYQASGLEPQLFPCPNPCPSIGIRLTATGKPFVKSKVHPEDYVLALGEILAFEGNRNAALNAQIQVANEGDIKHNRNIWEKKCLTDGFFLFAPVIYDPNAALHDYQPHANKIVINLDLGEIQEVDELRLWPAATPREYDLQNSGGIGFPTQIRLEQLTHPDAPYPKLLYKTPKYTPRPGQNPFSRRLPPAKGQYFRLTLENGFPDLRTHRINELVLGELELLRNGRPITRGIKPAVDIIAPTHTNPRHSNAALLTDGIAGDGKILPLRQWVQDFRRQRDLSRRRSRLQSNLALALLQEKERNSFLIAGFFALTLILSLMIWVVRLLASRRWANMREQIACDLHDEVGANLSSIAHTTEMIGELIPEPTEIQQEFLNDAIQTARITARDTRQFIRFLEHRENRVEVGVQVRTIARQILGSIDHAVTIHETRAFNQMSPIHQWDFFFFLKEALNNVLKHAGADHVDITILRENNTSKLIIEDNGCGIPAEKRPPRHLESRAKKLKGKLTIEALPDTGTRIVLSLKNWKKI